MGLAASKLSRDLKYSIDCLHQHLRRMSEQVHETSAARQFASPSELYSDLVALQTEFDEVEWDFAARTVSVNTEPIVLDDIDLGPFEIRLHWDQLHCHQPYETIALQPNRACLNESVTHPHVQDEALCEGEGASSIARSLEEGRLFDFFLLVRGVLTTYNPSSAYVSLQRWSGRLCPDCDDVVDDDSLTYCSGCERTICDNCATCCSACSDAVCSGCVQSCSECSDSLCMSCQKQCASCDATLCSSCQTEERCKACHDEIETETTDESGGIIRCCDSARGRGRNCLFLRDIGPTEIGGFGIASVAKIVYSSKTSHSSLRSARRYPSLSTTTPSQIFSTTKLIEGLVPARFARIWIHTHPGQFGRTKCDG